MRYHFGKVFVVIEPLIELAQENLLVQLTVGLPDT